MVSEQAAPAFQIYLYKIHYLPFTLEVYFTFKIKFALCEFISSEISIVAQGLFSISIHRFYKLLILH